MTGSRLMNARTGQAIADTVECASTRRTRRRGLLGRDHMEPAAALMLTPCAAVHTAFMRFAIDLLFLDRDGRAVRMVHGLPPWRAAAAFRAKSVVELKAGRLVECGVALGDQVCFEGPAGFAAA
jgi:uncharacterized membrane protein (UPF0127 family)